MYINVNILHTRCSNSKTAWNGLLGEYGECKMDGMMPSIFSFKVKKTVNESTVFLGEGIFTMGLVKII